MSILTQGGILMWPLAGLSVVALGIILDRGIVFSTLGFPGRDFRESLIQAIQSGQPVLLETACQHLPEQVSGFTSLLLQAEYPGEKEKALRLLADRFVQSLGRWVGLLGVIVRVAPLIGLLGTVLGMISCFAQLASASGGVDMTGLADGIWQALLTTAAGLGIAIPALLARHWFLQRQAAVADSLEDLIDAASALHAAEAK